jgi:hypothetical protein
VFTTRLTLTLMMMMIIIVIKSNNIASLRGVFMMKITGSSSDD